MDRQLHLPEEETFVIASDAECEPPHLDFGFVRLLREMNEIQAATLASKDAARVRTEESDANSAGLHTMVV